MNEHLKSLVATTTGASGLVEREVIQSLWSGYGQILRVELTGADMDTVIVKHVQPPTAAQHPRGWNTDIGHQRKLKSYQVELHWYETYTQLSRARLPQCISTQRHGEEVLIIMEDLDAGGFPLRKHRVTWEDMELCLQWLARFHASYMGQEPDGLWEVGTYWHLETRPQELIVLSDKHLKQAASLIDQQLNNCTYKTFVHGDAKLANFCFGHDGTVAGVDFQYVGGGCGMKDVAYFVGSCLREGDCERLEGQILDTYFKYLHEELTERNEALEEEWRSLYRVAWADFHRFLKGWSPGHWKINSYSERVTAEVIDNLNL